MKDFVIFFLIKITSITWNELYDNIQIDGSSLVIKDFIVTEYNTDKKLCDILGDITDIKFENVQFEGDIRALFKDCKNLVNIDLSGCKIFPDFDIDHIVLYEFGMRECFMNCEKLERVDFGEQYKYVVLGNFLMRNCFMNCSNLHYVHMKNFIVIGGVQCMDQMFANCKKISDIYLNNLVGIIGFGTMYRMFSGANGYGLHLDNLQIIVDGMGSSNDMFHDEGGFSTITLYNQLSKMYGDQKIYRITDEGYFRFNYYTITQMLTNDTGRIEDIYNYWENVKSDNPFDEALSIITKLIKKILSWIDDGPPSLRGLIKKVLGKILEEILGYNPFAWQKYLRDFITDTIIKLFISDFISAGGNVLEAFIEDLSDISDQIKQYLYDVVDYFDYSLELEDYYDYHELGISDYYIKDTIYVELSMTDNVTTNQIKSILNSNIILNNGTILYKGGIRNYLLNGDINQKLQEMVLRNEDSISSIDMQELLDSLEYILYTNGLYDTLIIRDYHITNYNVTVYFKDNYAGINKVEGTYFGKVLNSRKFKNLYFDNCSFQIGDCFYVVNGSTIQYNTLSACPPALFYNCNTLEKISVNNDLFGLSPYSEMGLTGYFYKCNSLKEINLSGILNLLGKDVFFMMTDSFSNKQQLNINLGNLVRVNMQWSGEREKKISANGTSFNEGDKICLKVSDDAIKEYKYYERVWYNFGTLGLLQFNDPDYGPYYSTQIGIGDYKLLTNNLIQFTFSDTPNTNKGYINNMIQIDDSTFSQHIVEESDGIWFQYNKTNLYQLMCSIVAYSTNKVLFKQVQQNAQNFISISGNTFIISRIIYQIDDGTGYSPFEALNDTNITSLQLNQWYFYGNNINYTFSGLKYIQEIVFNDCMYDTSKRFSLQDAFTGMSNLSYIDLSFIKECYAWYNAFSGIDNLTINLSGLTKSTGNYMYMITGDNITLILNNQINEDDYPIYQIIGNTLYMYYYDENNYQYTMYKIVPTYGEYYIQNIIDNGDNTYSFILGLNDSGLSFDDWNVDGYQPQPTVI